MNARRRTRALHVIDIENLVGHGHVLPQEAIHCRAVYHRLGLAGQQDLVVVGCNPYVGVDVGRAWAPSRLVVSHGPDGADRALTAVLIRESVERRFGDVVVASGDGAFVDPVVWLQARGVRVTVVAAPRTLSKRLRLAAWQAVEFTLSPTPGPSVAAKEAA